MIEGMFIAAVGFIGCMSAIWCLGRIANYFSAYKDNK